MPIRNLLRRWVSRDDADGVTPERRNLLRELEKRVHHRFKDRTLLNTALSHRSYVHDNGEKGINSYERLEFLGDAALGLVVSEALFNEHPHFREGALTKRKSSLVSRDTLARCADSIDLERYLLFTRGSGLLEGRSRVSILADAFEGVLGALYMDSGLPAVRRFLGDVLLSDRTGVYSDHELHLAKNSLLRMAQERFQVQPAYSIVRTRGPEHEKVFTCVVKIKGRKVGVGYGPSKKEAEKKAALNALRSMPRSLTAGLD